MINFPNLSNIQIKILAAVLSSPKQPREIYNDLIEDFAASSIKHQIGILIKLGYAERSPSGYIVITEIAKLQLLKFAQDVIEAVERIN